MKLIIISFVVGLALTGCSTTPTQQGRIFLDSSSHKDNPPDWVTATKNIWEKGGKVYVKATHSVMGTDRVNGCYDLARLDGTEAVVTEIKNDIRGSIDNAQQSISEQAEEVLGKVRSSEFSGSVSGMRFSESYFERYRINDTERIDCHTLAEISQSDYNKLKQQVLNKVQAVDPKLRAVITKKQIDFFSEKKNQEEIRKPTSEKVDDSQTKEPGE